MNSENLRKNILFVITSKTIKYLGNKVSQRIENTYTLRI